MNIFVLDLNPQKCAQYHCDKHVVKMILETAQILCSVHRYCGINWGYKSTHINHPCCIWARKDPNNYLWLKNLGLELCKEYTYRYNKIHKSQEIIENCYYPSTLTFNWNYDNKIIFPLCMPDDCKIENEPVKSYRKYYLTYKKYLLKYTKREVPEWIKNES